MAIDAASMGATSPDGIAFMVSGSPINPLSESAQQASSIQAALSLRALYDYVWADASAKSGQTGMRAGDLAFQVDIAQPYQYLGAQFGWCPSMVTHPASGGGRLLSGQSLITPSGSSGSFVGHVHITFPTGFFNATPQVTCSPFTANPIGVSSTYSSPNSAGFDLWLGRTDAAFPTTVSWTAIQGQA